MGTVYPVAGERALCDRALPATRGWEETEFPRRRRRTLRWGSGRRPWLGIRSGDQPQIKAIDGAHTRTGVTRSFQLYGGNETEIVVIDTPAGVTGGKLVDLYHKADSILIPVMPSIIDLQAMQVFLQELGRLFRQGRDKKHVGVIANRVRMRGKSYQAIEALMEEAGLPLVAGES